MNRSGAAFRSHAPTISGVLEQVSRCSPIRPNGIPLPVAAIWGPIWHGIPLPAKLFLGGKARLSAPTQPGRGIPLPVLARHSAPVGTALRSRANGVPLPVARRCAPAGTAFRSRWHGIPLPFTAPLHVEILNSINYLGLTAFTR